MKLTDFLNKIVDNQQLFNVEKWVLDKVEETQARQELNEKMKAVDPLNQEKKG